MIKKSFLWFYRIAFDLLGFFVIAFLSTIIAIQYFFLPHFDDYKGRITDKISQTLGQKVTIGDIHAKWNGLNPHLSISNMDIYDKEDKIALSLKQVEASLSWTSIPMLEPRLASLAIYNPDLTIRRETDGTVYMAGISMSGPSRPAFPNWLLRQASVNVVDADIIWQDELRHAPELELNHLNLQLENPAWDSLRGRHEFSLKTTPSAGSSKPIDIRGNFLGKDVSHLEQWHGTVYAKIEGTDLSAWRNWIDYPFDLREGHGAAQFWIDFADQKIEAFTSDLLLDNVATRLHYQGVNAGEESRFNKIAGRIKWEKLPDGQEIQGHNLQLLTSDNLNMKSGKFSIRDRLINNQKVIKGDINLDEIQLETLSKITAYFNLPRNIKEAISETEPAGKLTSLNLTWLSKGEDLPEYTLTANFSGLGLKPYTKFSTPGFTNLAGKIKIDQGQGKLDLQTKSASLSFPGILRWPVPADSLVGEIKWQTKSDMLNVDISRLFIKNAHFNGEVDGSYKRKGNDSQYVDLTASANNVDLQHGRFYYPTTISKDTVDWLDTSILSGRGENVNLVLRGNLKDYPWNGKNGLFKVTAKINNAVLDHSNGWPKIEDINLDMLFEGKRMELNATSGHAFGNQIKKAKITIPDLMIDDNVLDVVGEAQGPVPEAIKYINNSPIEKISIGFTDYLKTSGNGKLLLKLHIPLTKVGNTKIKGSYTVTNGSMQSDSIPELTKLNGIMEFTEASINANNFNAMAYGGPAQFSINTDQNHSIQITAKGHVDDTGLRKSFGALVPSSITGGADWSAKAQIANNKTDVSIRSNLIGINSNLPFPLKKSAGDAMPLMIDKKQISSTQDIVKMNLGSAVNAKFARIAQNGSAKIDRGDIGINSPSEINTLKGIGLHGNLEIIDIDEWLDQLDKNTSTTAQSGVAINRVDLTTNQLDIFDRRMNAVRVNAKVVDQAWLINLKSNEINGDIKWSPEGNGKVTANLSNLILPDPTPDAAKKVNNGAPSQLNIKYPALDIVADNFEINKKKMGHLELQAKEQFGNWGIDKLRLVNLDSTLSANGEWNNWKRRPNTLLRFNWEISDMGKALKRLNYGDTIKGGAADISGQLKWAGSPHEFDVPNLAGNLHLDAKKGQILKVEPGVARLFGVLSLQNLPRRLTLDFKDLFSSGFTFDKITADVNINKGIMHSDNFKMEGPTAKVEIKGDTDLDKETLHLHVKASPYISDTVSLAAFAGGPAVGAAAYIAQKVLKDPLNKIAEAEYEIVGTWTEPQERDTKPNSPIQQGIKPLN
jgi:uncharacterized protein (TIGR02099 family)